MATNIQQLSDSVTKEVIHDGNLTIYRLQDSKNETIDAYINSVMHDINHWDKNKIYFNLQDVSNPNIQFTAYFRKRLDEVSFQVRRRGLTTYAAIILQDNFLGRVMTTYGAIFSRMGGQINQRYFFNYEKGLAWVEEQMRTRKPVGQ